MPISSFASPELDQVVVDTPSTFKEVTNPVEHHFTPNSIHPTYPLRGMNASTGTEVVILEYTRNPESPILKDSKETDPHGFLIFLDQVPC